MAKITKEVALLYHLQDKPGKIEVVPTKPYSTQTDLSLACSPGVAEPYLEIEKNPQDAYEYTAKDNLVAVIPNGTAVLGLGGIGAAAGKPVMEGKELLFKIYGSTDASDVRVNEKDPDKFIEAIKAIAPTFNGINLGDTKAPEYSEIEYRLREELDIPVVRDDQYGAAIISSARLLNALEVAGKKIENMKIAVNDAGVAAISCTKFYGVLGTTHENIIMPNSRGVITSNCQELNETRRYFFTDHRDVYTLEEAIRGVDVLLGPSKGNVLTRDMMHSMAAHPIVLALANPVPGISYEDVMETHPDVPTSTRHSDYPNQINNVIGLPYIFRGALDVAATAINEEMKLTAVRVIISLAKQPVPDVVNEAYHVNNFSSDPDYFIPKSADPRLITEVFMAVAKTAMENDVTRKQITDWEAYRQYLKELMGQESGLIRQSYDTARRNPQRVVSAEGIHPAMLKAAAEVKAEGICHPVTLRDDGAIEKLAKQLDLNLEGIEVVSLCHPDETKHRECYAHILSERHAHEGVTYEEANDKMFECNYFGVMMVGTGEADAFIAESYIKYNNAVKVAKEVISIHPEYKHFGTIHILDPKKGMYFLAGTLINRHPNAETLIDIVKLAEHTVRFFNHTPVMVTLSHSNLDADKEGDPISVHEAVEYMRQSYPELAIDGEMQVNFVIGHTLRGAKYPFTHLKGKGVNILVSPNLSSANSAYELLQAMNTDTELIGPIQMGLNKPIHFTDFKGSVRDIVNITAVVTIDTIVDKKKAGKRKDDYPNSK